MTRNVYSIRQGNRQYLSFLSTAAGLMADLDLETEHLRWMGDSRFVLGYLQGGEPLSHKAAMLRALC
jgi:sphingosine kinase